ncbi:hypothetical protein PL321_04260 [Caloramator sp. mosi_1]|uniref:hypothetical protein n=1 Tax=Caloramator sp. mosi_1 TaxID=3023090 RepID=UPI0023628E56|nr:hypothetical protein [Caloramator sp. mosi_1]WDC85933.1 hypothetical protein PL321_04260 [Caloramator sp. mosi_1]
MQINLTYRMYIGRKKHILILLFILLLILSFISLNLGASKVTLINIIGLVTGIKDETVNLVLWRIRLPRILLQLLQEQHFQFQAV